MGHNANTTTVIVDAGDNGLYALNPQDGTIRWHLALYVERKPLVHAGIVYALVDPERFSLPSLNAYLASDGKLLWTVPQGIHNGRIELNSSTIYEDIGPLQPAAFSLRDGHVLWTGDGGFLMGVTDTAVFVEDGDYHVDALSASDGKFLWRSAIDAGGYDISYDVAPIVNSVLYVANASGLAAVRTGNGTLLWRYAIPNAEAVVVVNGVAYLYITALPSETGGCGAGACSDQVVALNATTGARLWQKSLPDGQLLAEPVAND